MTSNYPFKILENLKNQEEPFLAVNVLTAHDTVAIHLFLIPRTRVFKFWRTLG